MQRCLTCNSEPDTNDVHSMYFTFLKNGELVCNVLERCLVLCEISELGSEIICSKCLLMVEDYVSFEKSFRELRNSLWDLYKASLLARERKIEDFIRGFEVQTDDVQEENSEVESLPEREDRKSNLEFTVIDADPHCNVQVSPTGRQPSLDCSVCGMAFENQQDLRIHQFVFKHKKVKEESEKIKVKVKEEIGNEEEGENLNSNRIQCCHLCSFSFSEFSAIKKHMLYEHRVQPIFKFKCVVCGKTLTSQAGALYHGRSHGHVVEVNNLGNFFDFVAVDSPPPKRSDHLEERVEGTGEDVEDELKVFVVEGNSESEDEIPLATHREKIKKKQAIFKKIKKEVQKDSTAKAAESNSKKALAELKRKGGLVVRKLSDLSDSKEGARSPVIKCESTSKVDAIREFLSPFIKESSKAMLTKNVVQDDDGVKEIRLPPVKSLKFECVECGKMWKTRGELKAHTKSHSESRPFICEMCGQAYKHKHALEVHIAMHKGIFIHQCQYCQKAFTQKGALQRHLPIHTGDFPYQCELCGKRFVHRTSFSIHSMAHTGVRNIRCSVCNLGVLSKSHLRRHMRIHSGEKPYECPSCGKSFAERYNLVAHQRIHDPSGTTPARRKKSQQQYKCRLCSLTYANKNKLEEHMVEDHMKVASNSLRPTILESTDSYIPQSYAVNESESSQPESQHMHESKPEILTQIIARKNIQAARNMELLRASIDDGSIVRLSGGIIEPPPWGYITHTSLYPLDPASTKCLSPTTQ